MSERWWYSHPVISLNTKCFPLKYFGVIQSVHFPCLLVFSDLIMSSPSIPSVLPLYSKVHLDMWLALVLAALTILFLTHTCVSVLVRASVPSKVVLTWNWNLGLVPYVYIIHYFKKLVKTHRLWLKQNAECRQTKRKCKNFALLFKPLYHVHLKSKSLLIHGMGVIFNAYLIYDSTEIPINHHFSTVIPEAMFECAGDNVTLYEMRTLLDFEVMSCIVVVVNTVWNSLLRKTCETSLSLKAQFSHPV